MKLPFFYLSTTGQQTILSINALTVGAGIVLALVLIYFTFVYLDFRRHKAPLKAVDPSIKYTFGNFIKKVTIPTIRYRLQAKFSRPKTHAPQE